jgi:hypothetical protein
MHRSSILRSVMSRITQHPEKPGRDLVAIEVKTARVRAAQPGLAQFSEVFAPTRALLVGGDGIGVEEFLERPVEHWLG